ncbi:hypothetical protein LIER_22096 [Lithospermum erythrorhizon]|uniref:Uncharacterized protein n=1 Tax=Lithospermum erythrorhizon TaxID=34254 RepID=A0AAV3QVL8_LITER
MVFRRLEATRQAAISKMADTANPQQAPLNITIRIQMEYMSPKGRDSTNESRSRGQADQLYKSIALENEAGPQYTPE